MKLNYAVAGAALVAILGGAFLFLSPTPQAPVQVPPFMEKAGEEVILPPTDREEVQRKVLYGPDGFTRERLVVYFVNGETGVTIFHPDKSADVYRYHPSDVEVDWKAPTLTDRGMKSLVKFAPDTRSVISEKHWDVSGRVKRVGLRLPTGGYQVDGFFGDGIDISERSVYFAKGQLESRTTYWSNGNLKSTLKQTIYGSSSEWAGYWEDGKPRGFHKVSGNAENGEFYYQDGVTIRMKFVKEMQWRYRTGHSLVKVTYNNPDGSLAHTRQFEYNMMLVNMPPNGSTPAFMQKWKLLDPKRPVETRLNQDNFQLEFITMGNYDGLDSLEMFVDAEGKYVNRIKFIRKVNNVDERVTRYLRPDGTVEKEETQRGATRTERTFQGADGGRFVTPPGAITTFPYEPPPAVPSDYSYPYFGGP